MGSYDSQILPLQDQLDVLRAHNEQHWDNHFSEADFAGIDTSLDDGAQNLERATVVHAEFETPGWTFVNWQKAYFRSQAGLVHWNSIVVDPPNPDRYVRPHKDIARRYAPGLHVVQLDVTRHGDKYERRPITQIRAEAAKTGEILAHAEVLSLLGLNAALRSGTTAERRSFVKEHTPYMAGYECTSTLEGTWGGVPRIDTGLRDDEFGVRVFFEKQPPYGSVPVVLGE
jgi:hypothetical protein